MITASPEPPPQHAPSQWTLMLVLAALLVPFVWTSAFLPDEFTLLSDALRLRHGEVMYRDFFQFIGPVTHWLAALAFLPAGPSLVAGRVMGALLLLVAGWQLYGLGFRLTRTPWLSALPPLIMIVALHRLLPGFNHHWLVLPFVLGGLQAALRGLTEPHPRWWALAGVAAGVATLTVQSDGLALMGVLAGFLVLQWPLSGWSWNRLAVAIGGLFSGFALPLALVAAYFGLHGALGDLWHHTWTWPLGQYKSAGGYNDAKFAYDLPGLIGFSQPWVNVPYWYGKAYHHLFLAALAPAAALAALGWGLGVFLRRLTLGRRWSEGEAAFGLIGLLAIASLMLAIKGRADAAHLATYSVPALLVAIAAARALAHRMAEPELVLVRHAPAMAIALFLATGGMLLAQEMRRSPEAWLSATSPDARVQARPSLRYLLDRAGPGDRLAGMPSPGYYHFYAGRPATRFTLMMAPEERYNTEAEYQAFWREILTKRPRFVVVSPWNGEEGLDRYMRYPLPGYREAAREPIAVGRSTPRAVIFERETP